MLASEAWVNGLRVRLIKYSFHYVCSFFPMIDIQLLRKDINDVAARLAQRKFNLDVAAFNALEVERKAIQTRTEELQSRRNTLSKQIGILKGKGEDTAAVMNQVAGIGDELKASAEQLDVVQAKLSEFMLEIGRAHV